MTITKYEHACIVIEDQGSKVVIDPGVFSESLGTQTGVTAIVITHYHDDHIDEEKVRQLLAANSSAVLLSTQQVKDNFTDLPVTAVVPGTAHSLEPFHLEFCGGDHAQIHSSWPIDQNIGVMVNEIFYYPGDSFAAPSKNIKLLAVPVSAPWMKASEGMDYLISVKPEIAIPTHDAVLSEQGKQIHDKLHGHAAAKAGVKYQRLKIGESMTI